MLHVGIDLVQVSRIGASIETFGERFLRRVFTPDEIAYATANPAQTAERLAVRFAAKEATIKALDLTERGVGWLQIEVRRGPSGACAVVLHGEAGEIARAKGIDELAVSLSHEGDLATAIVISHTPGSPA